MSDYSPGLAAYKSACECDAQGLEAEAIPHYRRALAAGLPPEDRRGALLGLGSSLRNVHAYEESVRVLEGAIAEFPDYPALGGFLALSYRSAGRTDEAMTTLLDLCLTHAPLDGYGRALKYYREELDPTDRVALVRRLFEAIQARDWPAAEALFQPDATMTWWTSGERFEGASAIIQVNAVYPEGWSLVVEQVHSLPDGRVHSVIRVEHPPGVFYANSLFRFAEGRIATLEEWWATCEEPPEWRSEGALAGYRRL